ncbi:hypothetical protein PF010_g19973 [Phytophthora fragariae]|uniref:HTH CENPB-type domain-containing protein n=4 Tax=Phytophthora fragariae TaxID=53985 RepID=A0A6A3EBA2_9STRA|nr:hypothetical protein PF003_g32091 [Phytophthora fragariae]KAE8931009.1 hypothetical protein PF009_g18917 [Phytophthora fragariae]KAE9086744.1 hypothetical protein PF010_g19973 [Phytophthora fragariae]KAE9126972.1 hypothetical protein PF006_g16609 [Phytophthora fragariae]KAE9209776.1 hypothetical protein PF002_g19008 [Phytophthora fragariae]
MFPSRVAKTMAEKKEVVTWIENRGKTPAKAASHFQNERGWKISAAQVRYLWKQKDSIKNVHISNLRLKDARAKPRLTDVEDMTFDQVLFLRSEKNKVSRGMIADMGENLAQSELRDDSFAGSCKWVDGFMRRYALSLRQTTNLTALTGDVLTDRAVSFMTFLGPRIGSLSLNHTILMGETAVYFESPRRQTIDTTCPPRRAQVNWVCLYESDRCTDYVSVWSFRLTSRAEAAVVSRARAAVAACARAAARTLAAAVYRAQAAAPACAQAAAVSRARATAAARVQAAAAARAQLLLPPVLVS